MRRFFIDKNALQGKRVVIEGDEAHHIKDVIRLNPGDRFIGFDGTGKSYTLRIISADKVIKAEVEKVSEERPDMPRILLACAIPKSNKMDSIIEKATELGVSDIVPMVTERTVVKIDNKNRATKNKRWKNIALSASKQCGRSKLPTMHNVTNFKDAIELAKEIGYNKIIMPCLCEGSRFIKDVLSDGLKDIAVFIGPEGDFTEKEIEYAGDNGLIMVSLGELVLRVDTACVFVLSAVQSRV